MHAGPRPRTTALAALALAAACGSNREPPAAPAPEPTPSPAGQAKESAGPPDGEELVRLHLLADTTRVAPGQELTLAARFDIAPGWHLYWINPGESGLATEAAFTAPAGFEVGPVRYPGPVRFDSPGDITSYGYHDLVLLSAVASAPDRMEPTTPRSGVQFSVQASWLACREVCVRGQGGAALDLPVASAEEPAQPAHAELFEQHRAALPRPLAELEGARHRWDRAGDTPRLHLDVPGATRLEYFPPTGEDLRLFGQASVPAEGGARITLSFKPGDPASARGVLAVTAGDRIRYYQLHLMEEAPR
ncbi:MAG TPA: protein-disulfide reductase DsbD domain-containing protein [Kofleriaceae bacterium]|nr:protein-disulfide reductase DsbD domain-containing protein [Kofleriaceae bacterium]